MVLVTWLEVLVAEVVTGEEVSWLELELVVAEVVAGEDVTWLELLVEDVTWLELLVVVDDEVTWPVEVDVDEVAWLVV